MKTIPFTEARDNFNNVLDQVVNDAEPIVINGSGEGAVVVMSLHDYSSLMETVHLLRSANNSAHLGRSIAQYKGRIGSPKDQ
ncbi:MAG: type II toxin-antitoxin system prevent-host-death family antitoxin [Pseudomonadota bacterium]|jgi:antitoxin YefM|nr:type II toxin-antitoxin system prevent-host-death family antitoxin [Pseudomonadota bacterium]MEC8104690.1 type II toxin-antitoxin system prevent-host-death family antitoxin [Pseudomonadota bacterium]MEC8523965.1 type II toxin-antitoxin system prevent-host-death family antitoxin [Pseudomonadota bacterium]MED5440407.1 type II toxin-antitoxin system prevent-host-death family antitoxin [Pseudomonadota bacterium]|tara:strand:- start:527 stop:772 length:246 start_codon:yes stop_codon:yes gene_type:complete